MKTPKTLDEAVSRYLSSDELRTTLQLPNLEGDVVVATNAENLVACPVKYLKDEYKPVKAYPDWKSIIPPHNCHYKLLFSDLYQMLLSVEMYPVYDNCPDCDGEGELNCYHCGSDYDCSTCNGSGQSPNIIGQEYSRDILGQIDGVLFNLNYLNNLRYISETHGYCDIIIKCLQPAGNCIFYVDDILVVICPIRKHEVEILKTLPIHNLPTA